MFIYLLNFSKHLMLLRVTVMKDVAFVNKIREILSFPDVCAPKV